MRGARLRDSGNQWYAEGGALVWKIPNPVPDSRQRAVAESTLARGEILDTKVSWCPGGRRRSR